MMRYMKVSQKRCKHQQTQRKIKRLQARQRRFNMVTARHPPAPLSSPPRGRPTTRGPLSLGNDIIILRRWTSAVLRTSPSNSNSAPYGPSLILFLDKVTVRVQQVDSQASTGVTCYQKVILNLKPLSRPAAPS